MNTTQSDQNKRHIGCYENDFTNKLLSAQTRASEFQSEFPYKMREQ